MIDVRIEEVSYFCGGPKENEMELWTKNTWLAFCNAFHRWRYHCGLGPKHQTRAARANVGQTWRNGGQPSGLLDERPVLPGPKSTAIASHFRTSTGPAIVRLVMSLTGFGMQFPPMFMNAVTMPHLSSLTQWAAARC
jgi:hypothetical protein